MGKRCCLGLCMVGTGTEIIAVSNTILYLFTYPVCLYLLELRYKSTHRKEDENNEIISPLGTVLIILGELLMLGVSGMLLYGKIKRDPDFCKPWLYIVYAFLLMYHLWKIGKVPSPGAYNESPDDESGHQRLSSTGGFLIFAIVTETLLLFCSALLLYGITYGRPSFCKPWLYTSCMFLSIACVDIFINFVVLVFTNPSVAFIYMCLEGLLISIPIYQCYVVREFVIELEENLRVTIGSDDGNVFPKHNVAEK
ncbi:hypothetical protein Fcan01_06535 [Folsomia candida]|uniref:Uncharacterized protein n=1 Tax=Folsomia candida TaxID=158441 RepID=A0A226EHN3_FOLCA|nr:hypothetical protein Fcan01_06535 [Folsomia candida]